MVALFMDLLVVLTFECLILFKIMRFSYAWVLSEHLQHPVYVSKPMNHHYISDVKKLSLKYCLKLSSNQSNPVYNSVFNSKFISVFERKPTQLPPLAVRVSCDMKEIGFKKSDVVPSIIPSTPPWLLIRPVINLDLHCSDKSNTPPEIIRHRFYELCDNFKNYYRIFTDSSKEGNRVAAAVVHRDNTKCVRLPDTASIFRAELYALLLAIDVVQRSKERNFVIFSDSLSGLQAIGGFNIDSDQVQKFLKDYTILAKNGKNIVLCWIPSHVGIPGNDKADAAAKSALSLSITPMKLPATNMLPRVTGLISEEWQEICDCCAGNKLHAIIPTVGVYKRKTSLSRHDSVLINRLRIGHTRLTHSYLLSGDDQPECDVCQCALTVKHILIECVDLHDVRNKHFVVSSMKDLFENVASQNIVDFIKETLFYKQL